MKSKLKIVTLFAVTIFITSCSSTRIAFNKRTCPTNDRFFFYRKAGVKPTRAYMIWGNQ